MNKQNVTDMVLKLNRDTAKGTIHWSPKGSEPFSLQSGEVTIGRWYKAQIKDRWIRLYKLKQRYFLPFEERFEMVDSYRLEFIDGQDQPLWTFPYDEAMADLYETVTRKSSGADAFINDYLSE